MSALASSRAPKSHVLARIVELFQLLGQLDCFFRILREKKLQRASGRVQSSRRIDARPQHKAHMVGAHRRRIHAACLHQRLQPRIICKGQRPQTVFHQNPVFSLEIHHITHCGDGRKGKKLLLISGSPLPLPQRRGHTKDA